METGNLDLETGNLDLETGNLELETGNLDLETGNLDLETGGPDVDKMAPQVQIRRQVASKLGALNRNFRVRPPWRTGLLIRTTIRTGSGPADSKRGGLILETGDL